MRTLLVVSYHFLPVTNVGVKQFVKYCKYLPEFGWTPAVLTNDWSNGPAPRDAGWGLSVEPSMWDEMPSETPTRAVPHRERSNALMRMHATLGRASAGRGLRAAAATIGRRALSLGWPLFGEYPDAFVGWVPDAIDGGIRLARDVGAHAILSQCPPSTNHLVASGIARSTGIPWIPYFGDLVAFSEVFRRGDERRFSPEGVAARLRRHWLAPARGAFAVAPRMVRELTTSYGLEGDVVVVGFDPVDFEHVEPSRDKLRLAHVGSLYLGDQRPDLFMDAVDALLERRPEVREKLEIRFTGSKCETELREMAANRPSRTVYRIETKVSAVEAVRIQQQSNGLLLFDLTSDHGALGTLSYPSKIFEYLGAHRPILSFPGDGDWVEHILRTTGGGVVAHDVDTCSRVLESWYDEWSAEGDIRWHGRAETLEPFTHREQARIIAAALDRATDGAAA